MAQVEASFASALGERLGTDPDHDPYPTLLASAATAVLRATMSFWAGAGGTVPLEQLADAAFRALADGFPENGALRDLATGPPQAPPDRAPPATPPTGAPPASPSDGAPPDAGPQAVTQNFETERTTTDEHV
jgi:hypothetical protein